MPHYNPAGISRENFKNYSDSWNRKLKSKSFIGIFAADMLLYQPLTGGEPGPPQPLLVTGRGLLYRGALIHQARP